MKKKSFEHRVIFLLPFLEASKPLSLWSMFPVEAIVCLVSPNLKWEKFKIKETQKYKSSHCPGETHFPSRCGWCLPDVSRLVQNPSGKTRAQLIREQAKSGRKIKIQYGKSWKYIVLPNVPRSPLVLLLQEWESTIRKTWKCIVLHNMPGSPLVLRKLFGYSPLYQ